MAGQGRWAFGTLLQLGDGGETPVGGGASTTLAAQADAGANEIEVTSATGIASGDLLLIGGAGGQIRTAGTPSGTTVPISPALTYTVANGATVVEVAAETFATLAEVKDIEGPDISLDTEDITPHDAVGGWEEYIPTILRSGEITFDLNFVPHNPQHGDVTGGLISLLKNRSRRNWRMVLPTSPSYQWTFAAYVTGFSNSEPVGGVLGASVTLKVTGVLSLGPSA